MQLNEQEKETIKDTVKRLHAVAVQMKIEEIPDIHKKEDSVVVRVSDVSKFTFMQVIVFNGITHLCYSLKLCDKLNQQVQELFKLQIQCTIQTYNLMAEKPELFCERELESENLIASSIITFHEQYLKSKPPTNEHLPDFLTNLDVNHLMEGFHTIGQINDAVKEAAQGEAPVGADETKPKSVI